MRVIDFGFWNYLDGQRRAQLFKTWPSNLLIICSKLKEQFYRFKYRHSLKNKSINGVRTSIRINILNKKILNLKLVEGRRNGEKVYYMLSRILNSVFFKDVNYLSLLCEANLCHIYKIYFRDLTYFDATYSILMDKVKESEV